MKAILFCRVSTNRQEWESQKTELKKAALSDGYTEEDLIVNGKKESATKLDEEAREGIREMKECIEVGGVGSVYVWEISRLSRKDYELFELKKYFIDHHIQLICIKPYFRLLGVDGEVDAMAEIAFAMYSSMSQIEIRNKNARSRRGRETNALLMKKTGNSVRFGYKISNDGFYIVDDEDATIVRKIYEMYNNRNGLRTIQREIQAIGYTMGIPKIRRILRFEGYTGQAVLHSGITRNYPIIIDKETYRRAQEVKQLNNKWVDVKNKRVYISVPLLKCECGRCYASTGGANYRCTKSREEHSILGHSPMIKQSIIDDLAFDLAYEAEKQYQKVSKTEIIKQNEKAIADKTKTIKVIEKKVKEFSAKMDRITEEYIEGHLTKETRDKRREKVAVETKRLLEQKAILLNEIDKCKEENKRNEFLLEYRKKSIKSNVFAKQDDRFVGFNVDEDIIIKSNLTLLDKKELAKKHIKEIGLSRGKNHNSHIATIRMMNGVMYKYELNTRKKTKAVVLLETSRWS